METAVYQIGKKAMFLEFSEDPPDHFNVIQARVLAIDQNFAQTHDNKINEQTYHDEDIKLFGEDLIDIASKAG